MAARLCIHCASTHAVLCVRAFACRVELGMAAWWSLCTNVCTRKRVITGLFCCPWCRWILMFVYVVQWSCICMPGWRCVDLKVSVHGSILRQCMWCGWVEISANESDVFDFVFWVWAGCGARLCVLGVVFWMQGVSRAGGTCCASGEASSRPQESVRGSLITSPCLPRPHCLVSGEDMVSGSEHPPKSRSGHGTAYDSRQNHLCCLTMHCGP